MNPLDDDEEIGKKPPTQESIKSFWLGCSGLAVLAIVASVAVFFASKLDEWIASMFIAPTGQVIWMACYGTHAVIGASLIPALVLGALVPVLYWRGGLMQRFAISVVLAVTVMNLTLGRMGAWGAKVPAWQLIAILTCWVLMPAIFLWTPIKTRNLRLIVSSCLLGMTFCLSILHMFEAPQNINLLYWETLYGAAFGYALVRRNWGRVAILEADTDGDQIERTSITTLLELMAVCGLACAASMYWSTSFNLGIFIQLAQAAVLGGACILASTACIRLVLNRTQFWFLKWFVIGLLMCLLFGANSSFYFAVWDPWGTGNWRNLSYMLTYYEIPTAIFITSFFASVVYVVFMLLVGYWLRWCGWQTQDQGMLEAKSP